MTPERVRELLDYDPGTGALTWRVSRGSVAAGRPAGVVSPKGYRLVRVDGVLQKAHRVAWLHHHGWLPTEDIDHINGEKDDNRIANLRAASRAKNMHNMAVHRACMPSLGAYYVRGRWKASIRAFGRQHNLGSFATQEEAHAAYVAARRRLHSAPKAESSGT